MDLTLFQHGGCSHMCEVNVNEPLSLVRIFKTLTCSNGWSKAFPCCPHRMCLHTMSKTLIDSNVVNSPDLECSWFVKVPPGDALIYTCCAKEHGCPRCNERVACNNIQVDGWPQKYHVSCLRTAMRTRILNCTRPGKQYPVHETRL